MLVCEPEKPMPYYVLHSGARNAKQCAGGSDLFMFYIFIKDMLISDESGRRDCVFVGVWFGLVCRF